MLPCGMPSATYLSMTQEDATLRDAFGYVPQHDKEDATLRDAFGYVPQHDKEDATLRDAFGYVPQHDRSLDFTRL
jgi:hypothetical protein